MSELPLGGDFTKRDTQIAKGVGVLCMLFHHTVTNNADLPLFMQEELSLFPILGAAAKLCVSLLTILSGYGLARVYRAREKDPASALRFTLSRIVQLLSVYWPINAAVAVCMYLLCLTGRRFLFYVGPKELLLGLLGLRVCSAGWFLTAILILYAVFPLCYRLTERFGAGFLVISWLPWLLYLADLADGSLAGNYNSALYYLFSFTLGVWLALGDRLRVQRGDAQAARRAWLLFLGAFCLRMLCALPADPLLSLSILHLLNRTGPPPARTGSVLAALGKESARLWMLHIPILSVLYHFLPKSWPFYLPKFVLLVALSYAAAMVFFRVLGRVGYSAWVSRLRRRIEG